MQNTNSGSNYNSNNYSSNNYPSNNMSNNSNYTQNYTPNNNVPNKGKKPKNKKNKVMIVIISILSAVAIAMVCVLAFLVSDMFGKNDEKSEEQQMTDKNKDDEKPAEDTVVNDTRYVDSDTDISLYDGPGTEYMVNVTVPVGEELEITEYTDNGFAKTMYDNWEGYVETEFLSEEKPEMWEYDKTEVGEFVKDVLYGYVDSINEGDFGILSKYLTGEAKEKARSTYETVKKSVDNEEVNSVECYGVERVSKNSVSVVRKSTITIYKKNGEVKEVTEEYLTTVENTSSGMKVKEFEAISKTEKIISEATVTEDESEESSPEEYSEAYYWDYTQEEIDTLVGDSLEWYVDSVTTGDTYGADLYFKGDILKTEINNASRKASEVLSEDLIYVGCHTYTRLSPTRVSVVRESDIQINYKNGTSETVSESRVYVLENTGNGAYIVDIHK